MTAHAGAVVRPATAGDLEAVVHLEADNLGVDAWSRGLVEAGLLGEVPTAVYLVAEVDGQVVGHAVVSVVAETSELQRISVDRAHRRSGVGSALLAAVVEQAVAAGATDLLLEVREDNAGAQAFYEADGFVAVGHRRRYYADGAAAVVLSLGLGHRDGAVGGGAGPYGR